MRILHTMIRVGDLARSQAFYTEVLGMQVLRKTDYPGGRFTNVFVGYGPETDQAVLELTHNWDTDSYDLGNAFGHIAIAVPDAYKACDEIRRRGGNVVRDAGPMKHSSTIIAFVEDPDGYKIELVQTSAEPVAVLERLGLHRRELRAWVLYDWANSAFMTSVVTAVFPIYYATVAAKGLDPTTAMSHFSLTTAMALAMVALCAPVLGVIADQAAIKKRMLAAFLAIGIGATVAMVAIDEGEWVLALALFAIANIGASGSFVFYDSLLPHITRPGEIDRVSTTGYALGYLGGGLLLAVNLVMVTKPQLLGIPDGVVAVKLVFVSVAVWWLVFSVPLFLRVPEPPVQRIGGRDQSLLSASARGLRNTFRELRAHKQATLFMFAFLVFNDGIGTIFRMAVLFGKEIGLAQAALIGAVLLVQFVGVPFGFAFGALAGKIGAKRSILLGLSVYCLVSILAYFMTSSAEFFALAILVGMVQGGTQALSRSLFASMIPKAKASEFFGLFAVFEKFAGIFGPTLFGLAILATGSSRIAILSVIGFFLVGGALLLRVDVDAGRAAAAQADADFDALNRVT